MKINKILKLIDSKKAMIEKLNKEIRELKIELEKHLDKM